MDNQGQSSSRTDSIRPRFERRPTPLGPRLLGVLAVAAMLGAWGCGTNDKPLPLDPDRAPRAEVDRFSAAAGIWFVRDGAGALPAAGQPIDFDREPFFRGGFGPDGRQVSFYNFDARPTAPAPIYILYREGADEPVTDQLDVVGVVPGDAGYNDLWQVMRVTVPGDYEANTVTSVAEIEAGPYPVERTATLVNRPIVPEGSSADLRSGDTDPGATPVWYDHQVVFSFRFAESPLSPTVDGEVPLAAQYVAFNSNPGQPAGGPPSGFMTEADSAQTHNVLSVLPADAAYSPLWETAVYDRGDFSAVEDLESAMAAEVLATGAHTLNAPVVAVEPIEPDIEVGARPVGELSTVIEIDRVVAPATGWVVLFERRPPIREPVIGYAAVDAGVHRDLVVPLQRPAVDGETLYAVLLVDAGTEGRLEIPEPDTTVTDAAGDPVVQSLVTAVGEDLPAVRLELDDSGGGDYAFVVAEPGIHAAALGAAGNDPDLSLYLGWRYEIVNRAAAEQPLELVSSGATAAQDAVVLSQTATGLLENDLEVAWFDDHQRTIRFTATNDLAAAVDAYRSAVQMADMRGDISFR